MNAPESLEQLRVPATVEDALAPEWLSEALAPTSRGRRVTSSQIVEEIRTVATKVRFTAQFEGEDKPQAFCIKGLFNVDEMTARGGSTMIREADFYSLIGPNVDVRTPECVATVVDRDRQQGTIVMRDLIAAGARFCSALEPFTAEDAAASLEQIARLHAGTALLDNSPWITPRVSELANANYVTVPMLQELLDGERGKALTPEVRSAERLVAGMKSLAARDAARPQYLVHGDAHAGNIFRSDEGTGLIDWQLLQRGGWALDVSYHLCAVLPVEVAEREERNLLDHYLETMRSLGREVPEREQAWAEYRESVLYGYYLWAITRRVDPPIIHQFVPRLGLAVSRHESHRLLGIE
jgi:hypothetical protein